MLRRNSVDLGIDQYEEYILTALLPDYAVARHYNTEEMKPQERRILYSLNKKSDSGLLGKYKCDDEYRDFRFVMDGDEFVLKTDNWSSRIGGIDTYDADVSKPKVNEDGELIVDGAIKEYRLLDASVSDMRITPVYGANKKIISLTVGDEIQEYDIIDNTQYHSSVINKFMTCKPIK